MANTTFSGTVISNNGFRIGAAGPVQGGAVGNAMVMAMTTTSLVVTATANTDYTIQLPVGAIVRTVSVITTVAYGAATDATIQLGSTVGGAQYVAATTIKAQGKQDLTLVTAALPNLAPIAAPGTVYARVVQTGAASATGSAILIIEFAV